MNDRAYDLITFDCYGTLVDWRGGISAAFRDAADRDGVKLDDAALLALYNEIEPEVEAERYRSYREVLTESARRVAARLHWPLSETRATFLPESLPRWTPFGDTNAALERLVAAGYTLGLLSNTDDDLLAATRRHLTVPFDMVITAQQVRSYKPGHAHFETARGRLQGRRWLHAAQSYFHDVVPATTLGIPVAWINRHGEVTPPGGPTPDREFDTLTGLADWLA
jgi:2-haloacid dehalogenase/putative hydrolase of the HAD superfamily